MKANANLEGAAAGVEHRKEREYSPLSYTPALACPTGESFPERMPCAPSAAVRPRLHTYGCANKRIRPTRGRGRGFWTPGGLWTHPCGARNFFFKRAPRWLTAPRTEPQTRNFSASWPNGKLNGRAGKPQTETDQRDGRRGRTHRPSFFSAYHDGLSIRFPAPRTHPPRIAPPRAGTY